MNAIRLAEPEAPEAIKESFVPALSVETIQIDRRTALRGVASVTMTPSRMLKGAIRETSSTEQVEAPELRSILPGLVKNIVDLGYKIENSLNRGAYSYPLSLLSLDEIDGDPEYGRMLIEPAKPRPALSTIHQYARDAIKFLGEIFLKRDGIASHPLFPALYDRLQTITRASIAAQRELVVAAAKEALYLLKQPESVIDEGDQLLGEIGAGLVELENTPAEKFTLADFEANRWSAYYFSALRAAAIIRGTELEMRTPLMVLQREVFQAEEMRVLSESGFTEVDVQRLYAELPYNCRNLSSFLFEASSKTLPDCSPQSRPGSKTTTEFTEWGNIFSVSIEEYLPKLLATLAQGPSRYRFFHELVGRFAVQAAVETIRDGQRVKSTTAGDEVQFPETESDGNLSEIEASESSIPLTKSS